MIRALMTAASGMKAQQMQVDTIANNIANANTGAFKKSELSFRALLYQTYDEPGAPTAQNQRNPTGLQVGTGTEVAGSEKIFQHGALEPTSNVYSAGIQGEGFFRVKIPSGEVRYTRDGNFHRDASGGLVSSEGYFLDPPVTIPNEAISATIGGDGTVSVQTSEDGAPQQAGQINMYRFPNPGGLKAQGGNYFSETASSGVATQSAAGLNGTGILRQGYTERSNVSVVDELVGLILAQRNYEVNSRAIRVSDEMLQQVNQLIR
jgi:flagellar basal-body rod protein FlgG